MTTNTPEKTQQPWYITTTIPYVNAQPHIGFALEIVLTDALARYQRLRGSDVRFLTGTDDNSLKNVQAAEREGISTRELVDRNAARFAALRGPLNLSYDDFIRTSADPRHLPGVWKLWRACEQRGDIYKRAYRGLYCVGCECFYTEDELIDGLCPEHLTPPELVEEENYFFRLSKYTEQLRALIESDTLRIEPPSRKNEALGLIRQGLEDFSISRSRDRAHGWGILVPDDPEQVIYVWFDALGNYITALDYANDGPLYQRYWLNSPQRIHVLGKDVIRFHGIYWPAMLLSAGAPPPTTLFVHGFITVEGKKISKSLGNIIDPVALVERYSTDALRYYLLREIPAAVDGDFSLERFIRVCNADLADRLGNLLNRVVSMVNRYYGGIAPIPGEPDETDSALIETAQALPAQIDAALARFDTQGALAAIWDLVDAANRYVEQRQPWALAKQRKIDTAADARLSTTLYNLLEALRLIAYTCLPFLPETAESVAEQLGTSLQESGVWAEATRWGGYPVGTTVRPGNQVLFTKHEVPPTTQAAAVTEI